MKIKSDFQVSFLECACKGWIIIGKKFMDTSSRVTIYMKPFGHLSKSNPFLFKFHLQSKWDWGNGAIPQWFTKSSRTQKAVEGEFKDMHTRVHTLNHAQLQWRQLCLLGPVNRAGGQWSRWHKETGRTAGLGSPPHQLYLPTRRTLLLPTLCLHPGILMISSPCCRGRRQRKQQAAWFCLPCCARFISTIKKTPG